MDTPNRPNAFMFFWLLFSVFASVLLGVVIGIFAAAQQLAETGTVSADATMLALEQIPMWVMVVFSQVFIFGVPCMIYLTIHRKRIREILPLRRLGARNVLMVIGMSIAIYPLAMLLSAITATFFDSPISGVADSLANEGGLWLLLILFPILPSIFEEVFMRGIIFSGYVNVKIFTAAIVNGLFFGIVHQNFNQFSYAFVLGFVMCYLMWYTKSLWAPVLCHFVVNALGSLLMYAGLGIDTSAVMGEAQYAASGLDASATSELLLAFAYLGGLAAVFFGGFLLIYRAFKRHNLKRNENEGVVTDTYAAAIAAGRPQPAVVTWGFLGAVLLGFILMIYQQW